MDNSNLQKKIDSYHQTFLANANLMYPYSPLNFQPGSDINHLILMGVLQEGEPSTDEGKGHLFYRTLVHMMGDGKKSTPDYSHFFKALNLRHTSNAEAFEIAEKLLYLMSKNAAHTILRRLLRKLGFEFFEFFKKAPPKAIEDIIDRAQKDIEEYKAGFACSLIISKLIDHTLSEYNISFKESHIID